MELLNSEIRWQLASLALKSPPSTVSLNNLSITTLFFSSDNDLAALIPPWADTECALLGLS